MVGDIAVGVVENIAVHALGLAVEDEGFVDAALPAAFIFFEEAQLAVGVPAGMFDPAVHVKGFAVNAKTVAVNIFFLFEIEDGFFEARGDAFVGVEVEDPWVLGFIEGDVFLRAVIGKGMGKDVGIVLGGDVAGFIGGVRVNDDDFVGDAGAAFESVFEAVFFVEGNDYDG